MVAGVCSGGAVIQLYAVGEQDSYLTDCPTITFWRSVYRRYTKFAVEAIEVTFSGGVGAGRSLSVTVPRNGDLMWKTYFRFTLPAVQPNRQQGATSVRLTNSVGFALIDEAFVSVGGVCIDRQPGQFLNIWYELCNNMNTKYLGELVGRRETVTQLVEDAKCSRTYYVPLGFWFTRAAGNAFPLVASQNHDVRIQLNLRPLADVYISEGNASALPLLAGTCNTITNNSLEDASLLIDYVFLDTPERVKLAQCSSEYLITQVQWSPETPVGQSQGQCVTRIELNFNHPVTYLNVVFQSDENICKKNYFNYAGLNGQDPISELDLRLNNHSRFSFQDAQYFRTVTTFESTLNIPQSYIYHLPFGLQSCEVAQPSGALNMSRLDSVVLNVTTNPGNKGCVSVFSENYNVLRFIGGMAGIAYSN